MNGNAKILFFCMIFVGGTAFGQKTALNFTPHNGHFSYKNQAVTIIFPRTIPTRLGPEYFTEIRQKNVLNPNKILVSSIQPVITGNFYTQNFGFFCKKELQLEKVTRIPFKFRLGSVQQCDWMEGKPNTGMIR